MAGIIDITGPATIAALDGTGLSSLDAAPPGGISITDSNGGATITVSLAVSGGASLSASSAGGASVSGSFGQLTLVGSAAQVNAALASLAIASSGTGGSLSIAVTDSQGAAKSTTLGLAGYADQPLAFVAPPATLAVTAGSLSPLPGLTLAADGAAALALLGAPPEAMNLTLIASDGALLLDPAAAPGAAIGGDASGTLVLGFASSQLAEVNAVLGAVDLASTHGGTLTYIARETGGPLAQAVTSGTLNYAPTGTLTAGAETWGGGAGLWQSAAWSGGAAPGDGTSVTLSGTEAIGGTGIAAAMTLAGASLALSGDVALAGGLSATASSLALSGAPAAPAALSAAAASIAGSIVIDDAALSVQGSLGLGAQSAAVVGVGGTLDAGSETLGTGDTLLDFGSLGGGALALGSGAAAFLPGGGAIGQLISLGGGAMLDFAGLLQGGAAAVSTNAVGLSLAGGAILEGGGTLVAGDFSELGVIAGPGTILALGPAPLTIAAGSIGGGAALVVDPGAVLELGAVSPLYGVFNPTPLTIDSSVTVSFAPGASATQDHGPYPSARGEQGGVLLLDYPGQFAGTIAGFAPGDRIDLTNLSGLSLSNLTGHSFTVTGTDAQGATETDTIHASYASGLSPVAETDIFGDSFIGLRATTAALTLDQVPATLATIDAVSGFQEPVTGLGLLLPPGGTAALAMTVSAVNGLVAEGSGPAGSTITLTGTSALALDDLLGALRYTPQGGGSGDTIRFIGSGGVLNGLSAAVAVSITTAGTLQYQGGAAGAFAAGASWSGGNAPPNGDVLVLGSHAGAGYVVSGSGEAAAMIVSGSYDFAGTLGLAAAGTALAVDAGAAALFDANAVADLSGAVAVGDANGAGTAGIAGSLSVQGVTLAGAANAAGSMIEVTGALADAGTLAIGGAAAGTLDLAGSLNAARTTLGASGLLAAWSGHAALGPLSIAGTLAAGGGAAIGAGSMTIGAGSVALAGQASLAAADLAMSGGGITIGAEAAASFGTMTIGNGAVLDDAGSLAASALAANGAVMLENQATLAATGALGLGAGASLSLAGALVTAAGVSIASGAALSGFGAIGGTTGLLPAIAIAGGVTASGGTLTLAGDVSGNVTIGAGAALDLVHAAAGGTISFTGAGETLIINDVAAMQDTVSGMVAGDAVELVGIAPGEIGFATGSITIADPSSFGFSPAAGQPAPMIAGNGSGGSTITMGAEMPCFARGTRLLTPSGYRPVEALSPGDPLVTEAGLARGIRWIGARVIDLATDPAAFLLRPVVIAAGAFGRGLPGRALRLSPLHAVWVDGALIPAALLVNGASITRDDRLQAVTYYHVELARHDVVRAEGLPAETYRDTGNRHRFAAGRGVPAGPMPACAPLVTGGPALAGVRRCLHARAFALGYRLDHAPDIRFRAGPDPVSPRLRGRRVSLTVAERGTLVIDARAAAPAETDPASEDRRRLAVCIGGIRVDGRPYSWNPAGAAGWHPRAAGDRGLWTAEEAILPLPPATRRVSLELLATVPAWLPPAYPSAG